MTTAKRGGATKTAFLSEYRGGCRGCRGLRFIAPYARVKRLTGRGCNPCNRPVGYPNNEPQRAADQAPVSTPDQEIRRPAIMLDAARQRSARAAGHRPGQTVALADVLDDAPVAAARARFEEFVAALGLHRARQLLAVMYAGRGDGSPRDVLRADSVYDDFTAAEIVADQLAGKVPLIDYLLAGLTRCRRYLKMPRPSKRAARTNEEHR